MLLTEVIPECPASTDFQGNRDHHQLRVVVGLVSWHRQTSQVILRTEYNHYMCSHAHNARVATFSTVSTTDGMGASVASLPCTTMLAAGSGGCSSRMEFQPQRTYHL